MLPVPVLERCASEMLNYKGSGMSVMEMSHRSKVYDGIIKETEAALRRVLSIPENYKVLFLKGGATTQFAAIPMNLMKTGKADYAITGNFANNAYKEAVKFGDIHVAFTSKETNFDHVPAQGELDIRPDADYFYICANNTIYGTEYQYDPETPAGVPLVADMSSNILSRPVDVSKYGVIYAGAQKNMGPAGVTVVIVREDLLGQSARGIAPEQIPTMMNYTTLLKADSMYNTPPCWCIYMTGLVMDYLEREVGGLEEMHRRNAAKAKVLYDYLDSQDFYRNPVQKEYRSLMNVTFTSPDPETDKAFCAEAAEAGLVNLKGHRLVGGMRASIYNAMPAEGVNALVAFMEKFRAAHQ